MQSLLIACVLSLPGVTGTVSDSFTVPLPVDSLAKWVASNPSVIASAAGSQVVWRQGNQFHVRRSTPRGAVEATMQDKIERIPGGYKYSCSLAPGPPGVLQAYQLDCQLVDAGSGRSRLSIHVQSTVNMRVQPWQLERSMRQSLAKVRELFEVYLFLMR